MQVMSSTATRSAVALTVLGLLQGVASFGLGATLTYDFRGVHFSLDPKPQWSTAGLSAVNVAAAGSGNCETQGYDAGEDALHIRDGEGIYIPQISSIIADGAPFTWVMDFKWSTSGYGGWMRILNTLQGSDIGFYGYGQANCWQIRPYPYSPNGCVPRNNYARLVYRQENGYIHIHAYNDQGTRVGGRWDIRSRRTQFSTSNDELLFFNDQRHDRCYSGGEHSEAYVRTLQVWNRRLSDQELTTVMNGRVAVYTNVTAIAADLSAVQATVLAMQTAMANQSAAFATSVQEQTNNLNANTDLIETQISTTNAMESRMIAAESRMLAAEDEVTALQSMMAGLAAPSDSLLPDDNTNACSVAGATSSSPKILTDAGSVNITACGGDITFKTSTCSFNPCAVQQKLNEIDGKLSGLGPQ
jgi:hypothetical protein